MIWSSFGRRLVALPDAYLGERIKILAVYDPTANEREKATTG